MFVDNSEEMAQNKLLLLYIIKESPNNFSRNELTEFILEKNYMNFFSIQQYISELIDSAFIENINVDEKQQYRITEKGDIALNYFISKIPEKTKKDLEVEFKSQKIQKKKETQVFSEYFQREDGQFIVNLKLVENSDTLFSLYLNVASKEQAEMISDSWKEKTDLIYSETIKLLID
ncbi:MAG: DUF4364 family protein [Tissierellaceae bacterium]|nr:DUF4364 family protein [Tissierellaceae bacterium]